MNLWKVWRVFEAAEESGYHLHQLQGRLLSDGIADVAQIQIDAPVAMDIPYDLIREAVPAIQK